MTKKRPTKCLEDFYSISLLMRKNCEDWSKDIVTSSRIYFFKTYCTHLIHIALTSENLNELHARMREAESFFRNDTDIVTDYSSQLGIFKRYIYRYKLYDLLYLIFKVKNQADIFARKKRNT